MTEIEELTTKLREEVERSQEWMRKCELAQKRADAAERAMAQMVRSDSDGNEYAHVVTLKRERDEARAHLHIAGKRADEAERREDAARARNAELEAALRPFAEAYWTGVNGGNETRMLNPIGIDAVKAAQAALGPGERTER